MRRLRYPGDRKGSGEHGENDAHTRRALIQAVPNPPRRYEPRR